MNACQYLLVLVDLLSYTAMNLIWSISHESMAEPISSLSSRQHPCLKAESRDEAHEEVMEARTKQKYEGQEGKLSWTISHHKGSPCILAKVKFSLLHICFRTNNSTTGLGKKFQSFVISPHVTRREMLSSSKPQNYEVQSRKSVCVCVYFLTCGV